MGGVDPNVGGAGGGVPYIPTPEVDETEVVIPSGQQVGGTEESTVQQAETGVFSPDILALGPNDWRAIIDMVFHFMKQSGIETDRTDTEQSSQRAEMLVNEAIGELLDQDKLKEAFLELQGQYPELSEAALNGNPIAMMVLANLAGLGIMDVLNIMNAELSNRYDSSQYGMLAVQLMLNSLLLGLVGQMLDAIIESNAAARDANNMQSQAGYSSAEAAEDAAEDDRLQDDIVDGLVRDDELMQELSQDEQATVRQMMKLMLQLMAMNVSAFSLGVTAPTEIITEEKIAGFSGRIDGKIDALKEELNQLMGDHPLLNDHPAIAETLLELYDFVNNPGEIEDMTNKLITLGRQSAEFVYNSADEEAGDHLTAEVHQRKPV